MKRFLPFGLVAAAVAALIFSSIQTTPALAQAGMSCPIATGSPVSVSSAVTTVTLTVSDDCKTYVMNNTATGQVNLPATGTVEKGWTVWIKQDGSATDNVTPTTGNLDGLATAVALTQGTAARIVSDGTNFFSISAGAAHHP